MSLISVISDLIKKASFELRSDVLKGIKKAVYEESSPTAKKCLNLIIKNAEAAKKKNLPLCQDTGVVNLFLYVPERACIPVELEEKINRAVSESYSNLGLRMSTVTSPLGERKNTGDNTPAFVAVIPVRAKKVKVSIMLKGAGSENTSFQVMMNPTSSNEKVVNGIVKEIKNRAPYSCPPIILGVGIGSTFDKSSLLAKTALFEDINAVSKNSLEAEIESSLIKEINKLGIGACAVGGRVTCIGANVRTAPTHIASLPIAVNISCHSLRTAEVEIPISRWEKM